MRLEVGTIIYTDEATSKRVITRVTEKRAFAKVGQGELCFDREQGDGALFRERGKNDRWFAAYYSVETPALKKNHERAVRERMFSKIKVSDLSDEALLQILKICAEIVGKKEE